MRFPPRKHISYSQADKSADILPIATVVSRLDVAFISAALYLIRRGVSLYRLHGDNISADRHLGNNARVTFITKLSSGIREKHHISPFKLPGVCFTPCPS